MAWRNYGTGSKYHAKKVSILGEVFDSKREAARYMELKELEMAGRISGLQRQKKFVLVPAQYEPETTGPRGGKIKGKLLEREVARSRESSSNERWPIMPISYISTRKKRTS